MAAGCCVAFCMQVSLRAPTEVRETMAMNESVKKVAITDLIRTIRRCFFRG